MFESLPTVIGLILGVLGAIGGVLWLKDKYKRNFKDSSFWKVYNVDRSDTIFLVVPSGGKCSDQEGPETQLTQASPNIITTVEDSMAKGAILGSLIEKGLGQEIRLHSVLSETEKQEHLFLICGPAGNLISQSLLNNQRFLFPYKFAKDVIWRIKDDKNSIIHPDVDSVTKDYAIIAKLPNPWSHPDYPKNLYFAAGIEALGTWGASHFLSNKTEKIIQYLEGPCRVNGKSYFVGIVSVERQNNLPVVEITHLKPITTS